MRKCVTAVLPLVLAVGCGDSDAPLENERDSGKATNACGGDQPLVFLGRPASRADVCGFCGSGALVCAAPNVLACLGSNDGSCGDGGINACGGRNPLILDGREAAPGERCGPCGDGTTICAAPEILACIGGSSGDMCRETDGGNADVRIADST